MCVNLCDVPFRQQNYNFSITLPNIFSNDKFPIFFPYRYLTVGGVLYKKNLVLYHYEGIVEIDFCIPIMTNAKDCYSATSAV